jgi:1,2-diacylglycerol 3-alpha-glucosyltransferase
MKIAIFSDCYLDLIGGIASTINTQKAALERLDHTVYIFSTGFPRSSQELRELASQNIFVVPSCKLFFRGLTPVSRRPKIIEKWLIKEHPELKDFDIFYIHYEAGCSIAGLKLAKKLQIPAVQVMHGREDRGETNIIPFGFRTIVAYILNFLHALYLPHKTKVHCDDFYADSPARVKMWSLMVNHANSADLVITPSAHFRDKLAHYGVTQPIQVIPNSYSDENFLPNASLKTLTPGEELRITWHSRVSAEKRMMPFLQALTGVKGKYHLDVFGGGGDYFRAQRFAKRHHLNVDFHGNAQFSQIQDTLNSSHLDVLVSYDFDTFGVTLIEAEAAGVPVFFCDPDMKEIVPPGSYILSKNETPEEMAKSLNHLLNHPEEIAQMSQKMLDHRAEVLSSNRIKLLIKAFNNIIA